MKYNYTFTAVSIKLQNQRWFNSQILYVIGLFGDFIICSIFKNQSLVLRLSLEKMLGALLFFKVQFLGQPWARAANNDGALLKRFLE